MAEDEAAVLFETLPEQAAPERVGGGVPRLRCAERHQVRWRPFSLDELLEGDHRARRRASSRALPIPSTVAYSQSAGKIRGSAAG